MTDQELKDLVASLAVSQKETGEKMRETDRFLKEIGNQIGCLHNKFGSFAEGMALPSLEEMMQREFGVDQIMETRRFRRAGQEMELSLIGAYNGTTRTIVAAEVKSSLDRPQLDRFVKNLSRFFDFLPQFRGYKLYGILAAIEVADDIENLALAQGVYIARVNNDAFQLKQPQNFHPRDFSDGKSPATK